MYLPLIYYSPRRSGKKKKEKKKETDNVETTNTQNIKLCNDNV